MVHEKIGCLKGDAEVRLSCGCVPCPEEVVQRHEREFARPTVTAPVQMQIICIGASTQHRTDTFIQPQTMLLTTLHQPNWPALPASFTSCDTTARKISRQTDKKELLQHRAQSHHARTIIALVVGSSQMRRLRRPHPAVIPVPAATRDLNTPRIS